jgi:hypothetical protein
MSEKIEEMKALLGNELPDRRLTRFFAAIILGVIDAV